MSLSIFLMATLEKGAVAFEIAWSFFLHFFLGGNPWKRESGDSRLLWDHFLFFLGGNPWKKESGDLRLLWDYFIYIFGGTPWKILSDFIRFFFFKKNINIQKIYLS